MLCSTHSAEKEDIYLLGVILLEVITGRQIATSSEVQELKDEVSSIYNNKFFHDKSLNFLMLIVMQAIFIFIIFDSVFS